MKGEGEPYPMKILIIDRDEMFSNLLSSKMRAAGHDVVTTAVKNDGIEQIGTTRLDAVYFDPAPLTDPKPVLLQIRRMVHTYPYLVLVSEDGSREKGILAGCNDGLAKPLDSAALMTSLENAGRMGDLVNRIGDESYDFPSAGGVISKSAFNQLFRSAIDRASRYRENAHALFISLPNYDDIKIDDGKYAADYAVSKLAQTLARLRRQSDILAQTGENEFALLLQRPQAETEPVEAARRFSSSIDEQADITSTGVTDLFIDVSLVHLPTGALEFHRASRIKGQAAASAG